MRLSIISFTESGKVLSASIAETIENDLDIEVYLYTKCHNYVDKAVSLMSPHVEYVESSLADWTKERMREKDALLFIGACGIAVRAIAPFLTDKLHDVPVLVMDEKGKYIIPILSGHMGGANELARYIAGKMGAEAVITTATDINGKFAVDLFAKRNNLHIVNKDGIVKVSSKAIADEEITISIETGHEIIGVRDGVRIVPYPPEQFTDIVVTSKDDKFDVCVILKPREYVIGFGCKKGKVIKEIESFIFDKLNELGISITQVAELASVSNKRGEQGIIDWCKKEGLPFITYTAEELEKVDGNFTASTFVKAQVGVDNVCERAAVKGCGECGKLIAPKTAENGMTIAVAKKEWKVCFDEE
ncbi:MAG: cobalt-precorrin 5A hydrolase [Clostridiales bacterium]|nr:cobalt-precorrin 5A hydrolase [Clostridiales bacterium]